MYTLLILENVPHFNCTLHSILEFEHIVVDGKFHTQALPNLHSVIDMTQKKT